MKKDLIALTLVGVLLLAILIAVTNLFTDRIPADRQAVSAANNLYAAGNYTEAARIYEQLIAQGVHDSAVFYDLGNTYFSQGDLGRAILNYQRAAQLDPRDADIRANLALARSRAEGGLDAVAPGPVTGLANVTGSWLTLNETAILLLGLWFLLGLLLLTQQWSGLRGLRMAVRYLTFGVLLLVVFTGLSLGSRLFISQARPEGVVVAPVVAVSDGPGEEYVSEFNLTSGAEVSLLETHGDWVRMATPGNAMKGWVPLEAVESVADLPPPQDGLI